MECSAFTTKVTGCFTGFVSEQELVSLVLLPLSSGICNFLSCEDLMVKGLMWFNEEQYRVFNSYVSYITG